MSMIASVLHLDRKATKALGITDLYSLHRVVYSLYDDVRDAGTKAASMDSGILFADQGGDFYGRRILMLANRMPADCVNGAYGKVQSKSVPEEFLNHALYRFKVIINPTRRESASRKLIPVKGRAAIEAWFTERATQNWGFSVSAEHLQVDKVNVLRFYDKCQRPVTICQAHIQGQLRVINHSQFCKSFKHGIGRAHTFGCGLLQITPMIDQIFSS